jgi:two-component system response regulator HydG
LPPLRERKDDIPLLSSFFLKEYCVRENKSLEISPDVMELFNLYPWPGNIRQLKNIIERSAVLVKGRVISVRELSDEIRQFAVGRKGAKSVVKPLREMEMAAIRSALLECKDNKSKVAEMLGISRKTLYKKMREMDT